MKFDTTVTDTGILTKNLNEDGGILILFEDTTQDVFKDFGTLHPKTELNEDIVLGDTFNINGVEYKVIAVGETANQSLRETGHVSIHVDDNPELEATSIIIISGPPLKHVKKGSRIFVQ